MPRPPRCRRVAAEPRFTFFKPSGIAKEVLDEVVISVDELEAIRLKDRLGLDQEECAQEMNVSRPTFQRILQDARNKLAEALLEGKAIRIAGGCYHVATHTGRICPHCNHHVDEQHSHGCCRQGKCPACAKDQ